jgi:glutamyl-Q tRNA(Asp) synthetase
VAALASWLDAKVHGGAWLVRIEDIDRPRCVPGMGEHILSQLARCGLVPDEPVWWQHTRDAAYGQALQQLLDRHLAYPCGCSRAQIQAAQPSTGQRPQRFEERVYPGTCRNGLHGKAARAVRLRLPGVPGSSVDWHDRRLGPQQQDVALAVGDFVLRRADGLWAYQLAVVVDDAAQGITDVVRGQDLADNTARQVLLQRALGLPTPRYLHTPLVMAADGHKLSKQNGAAPLDLHDTGAVLRELSAAADVLGLTPAVGAAHEAGTPSAFLARAVAAWAGIIAHPAPARPPEAAPRSGDPSQGRALAQSDGLRAPGPTLP